MMTNPVRAEKLSDRLYVQNLLYSRSNGTEIATLLLIRGIRMRQWMLSNLVFIFALKLFAASPTPAERRVEELGRKIKYTAEQFSSDIDLDKKEEKIFEMVMLVLSLVREAPASTTPLLKNATSTYLVELQGPSLSEGRIGIRKFAAPAAGVFYPDFLNRIFIELNREVVDSLHYRGYSSEKILKIQTVLMNISAEFSEYATTGKFKSAKYQRIFEISQKKPLDIYKDFQARLKTLINEQWDLRKEKKFKEALAKLKQIKALYLEAEELFKNPFFQNLEGAKTLYEFKQIVGQKRYNHPDDKPENISVNDLDFSKPLMLANIISEMHKFRSFTGESEVGKDYANAVGFLFADLSARRAYKGNYAEVLVNLRKGTVQGIDLALRFFENPEHQDFIGGFRNVDARGLSHFVFPHLLKAANTPRLVQLKPRLDNLLSQWKDNTIVDQQWVIDRLYELAETKKPRLGYESVDAEARDLLNFAYLGEKFDERRRKAFFDSMYEFAIRHPGVLKTYFLVGEPGRLYYKQLVEDRGYTGLLTSESKNQMLVEFFPNPKDRSVVSDRFTIPRLESAVKTGVMDLGTLLDLYFAMPANSRLRAEVEKFTNAEINKIEDPIAQRRIKALVLRKMLSGGSQILGAAILDVLKKAAEVRFCAQIFRRP